MRVVYPFSRTFMDYPDNESEAILVYIMGCESNCKGCQNPEFQDYKYKVNTIDVNPHDLAVLLRYTDYTREASEIKVVLSGGDPLAPKNYWNTMHLLHDLKFEGIYNICIYTSIPIKTIKQSGLHGFEYIKSGKYIEELKTYPYKDDTKMVFASSNQELYDFKCDKISKDGVYYFKEN